MSTTQFFLVSGAIVHWLNQECVIFFPYILTCSAKHLVRGTFYLYCVKKPQWTSELIDLHCMDIILNYTLYFLVEITFGCNQFAMAKAYQRCIDTTLQRFPAKSHLIFCSSSSYRIAFTLDNCNCNYTLLE